MSLLKAEASLDVLRYNKDYDGALRAAKAMKPMVAASSSPASEANRLTAQGECFAQKGKGDEARRYLVRALQTQKDCVDALIVLAELNIKQGVWPLPAARLRASRSSGVTSRTLAEVQASLALACCEKFNIKSETNGDDETLQTVNMQQQVESGSLFRSNDTADPSIDSPVLSSIASAAAASAALGFSVVDSVELLSRARDLLFTSFSTSPSRLLPSEPHRLFIRVRGMALLSILSEQGYLPLQNHSLPISENIQNTKGLKDSSFVAELSPCGKCLLLSIAATDVLWQLVATHTGTLIPQRLNTKVDGVIAASYCLSNTVRASLCSDDLEDLVLRTEVSSLLLSNPNFLSSSSSTLNESQQKQSAYNNPSVDWKQLDAKIKSIVISRIVLLPRTLRQLGDHQLALRCASSCLDFEGNIFRALQPKDKKCLSEIIVSLLTSDDAGIGLQSAAFLKDFPSLIPPWMWCVGGADSTTSQALFGGGNWHFTNKTPSMHLTSLSKLLPFVGPIVALAATTRAASNHLLRFRYGYCLLRKVEEDIVYSNSSSSLSGFQQGILSQKEVIRISKRAVRGLLQAITMQPISSDFASIWRLLAYLNAIQSSWSSPSSFSVLTASENEWRGRTVQLSTNGGGACFRTYCISAGIANRQAVALVEALISSIATISSQQSATPALVTRSDLENDLNDISGFVPEPLSMPTSPSSTSSLGNFDLFSKKLHIDDSTLFTLAAHASLFHANNPGTALQFATRAVSASVRETQSYAAGDEESRVAARVQAWSKDLHNHYQQSSSESNELPSSATDSPFNHALLFSERSSFHAFIDPVEASFLSSSAIADSRSEKQISALYILALSLVASARAISGNDSTGGASSGAIIGGGSACGGFDSGTSSKRMIKNAHRILLNILKITALSSKTSPSSLLSSVAVEDGTSIDSLLDLLPSNQWHVAYLLGLVSLHRGDATTALSAARKAIALSNSFGDSIATSAIHNSSTSFSSSLFLQSILEPAFALPWALAACASSLVQSDNSGPSAISKTSVLVLGGLKQHPNDCLLRLIEVLAAERLLAEKKDSFELGEIQSPQPTVLAGGMQEVLTSMRSVAQACDVLAWRFIEACAVQATPNNNNNNESATLAKNPSLSFGSPDALGKPSPPAPYLIKLAVCAHLHVSRLSAALKLFPLAHSALVKADSLVDATSLSLKMSGSSLDSPAFYSVGVDPVLRADVIHAVGVLHEAAAGYVVSASAVGRDNAFFSQSSSLSGSQLSSSLSGSSASLANSSTPSRVADPAGFFALGGFSHAEAQYAAAVAVAPNHVASLVRLGELSVVSAILRSSGQTLDNHSAARKISSSPVEVSCNAILLRDLGIKSGPEVDTIEMLLARAEGFITRALRVDEKCADAWSVSSRILSAQGRRKHAGEAALKAIDLRQETNQILPPGMLPLLGKHSF